MKKYEKYVLNFFPIKNLKSPIFSKTGFITNLPKYQYPYLKVLKKINNFSIITEYKNLLTARDKSELIYNLLLINLCKEKNVMMYPIDKSIKPTNKPKKLIKKNLIFLPESFEKCLDIFVLDQITDNKKIFKYFYRTKLDYLSVFYFAEKKMNNSLSNICLYIFYTYYIEFFKEDIEKKYGINYKKIYSYHNFYEVSKNTNLMEDYYKNIVPVLEKKSSEFEKKIKKMTTPELVNKIKSKIIPMVGIKDVKSLIDNLNPAWNKKDIEKKYCDYVEK